MVKTRNIAKNTQKDKDGSSENNESWSRLGSRNVERIGERTEHRSQRNEDETKTKRSGGGEVGPPNHPYPLPRKP